MSIDREDHKARWGIDPEITYHLTGADLVSLVLEGAGAASGVFLRRHPREVMPTEDVDNAIKALLTDPKTQRALLNYMEDD